ncbi:hypothetical protein [Mycolicibacterium diernhoferi]|uniref:hypothetical protein n=1 Tax=Mycolicibacterium diernhoferi TaxID=1801 RepID=UPI0013F683BB|nr:hypothetical protein [Mycolicibacterium diernhoferi]QYL21332.1 hypothetical protein K0O62_20205 [Mycolicibacterium diernhoferi]
MTGVELADGTVVPLRDPVDAIDGYQDIGGALFGYVRSAGRHLLIEATRIEVACCPVG